MEYLSCEIQFPNSLLFFKFSFPVSIQLNSFDLIFSKSPKNPLILDQPCSSFWHTTFINNNNNNYNKPSSSMGKSKPLWNSFDLLGFPFEFQLKLKKKKNPLAFSSYCLYFTLNLIYFGVDWGNYWLVFDVIETLLLSLQANLRKKRQQFWIATKTIIVVWVRLQPCGRIKCRCWELKKSK